LHQSNLEVPMIANVLASVAVRDLQSTRPWYERLLGRRPDSTPMPEIAEWKFPSGGWLQVYQVSDDRVGKGSCTFAVDDIDRIVAHATTLGVDVSNRSDGDRVRTLMITDPDGNHLAFAQSSGQIMAG
jgi:predicted enzyme related to lactoylglutathione lyase